MLTLSIRRRDAHYGTVFAACLFEAVFKVIEERLPFGRHLVTIVSVLMLAVIVVFCVGYLIEARSIPANWIAVSIGRRSFASVPHLSGRYAWIVWWMLVALALYAGVLSLRFWQTVKGIRKVIEQLNQNGRVLNQYSGTLQQLSLSCAKPLPHQNRSSLTPPQSLARIIMQGANSAQVATGRSRPRCQRTTRLVLGN